ncbi:hypothetical protein BDF20DRAFT_843022 [Mycotypha africana]|uniref:uncharacterized protein n=1 Tax=Mycotypha africana TaxID=64632 RepID=UPI002301212D|nr:uncharacterized protein BDF20DRAFT_843022 [Mycotypha africana]KAI8991151.1 hypothetical protein BDF20DRAFT_843022 [Mycotypha africana]
MTISSRSRSNYETTPSSHTWFDDIFASYKVPAELGKEDVTDPSTGNAIRLQSRYLGNAWMYCGSHSSQVMVYEIVQSEISDFISDHQLLHPSTSNDQQPSSSHGNNSTTTTTNLDLHSFRRSSSTSSHSSNGSSSGGGSGGEDNISALPPKKRRRRKVIHYQVIFSTLLSEDMTTHIDPNQNRYYLFPKEAILDTVNDMPPFEAYISFHLPDHLKEKRIAATCSTTTVDSVTSSIPPISIRLSGMSNTLYVALKQTISEFENTYEKMMALMKLHKQQVSAQRFELDEEDLKFESIITQRINNHGMNGWTGSEEEEEEEELEDDVDIDEDGEIAGDDDYGKSEAV